MPQSPANPQQHTVLDPQAMTVAALYAQAALDNLPDDAAAESLADELAELVVLLDGIDGAYMLLASSALRDQSRREVVQRVFAGRVSEPLEALLGVMAAHGRLAILGETSAELRRLLNKRQGRVEVTVATAVPLSAKDSRELTEELQRAVKAPLVIRTQVDSRLIGGMVVKVGESRYDASVAAQLARLRAGLYQGRSRLKVEKLTQ
jgi:F-type H+-transporting ATPase subunit delta